MTSVDDEQPLLAVNEIRWGLGGEQTLTAKVFGSRLQRRERESSETDAERFSREEDEFQESLADLAGHAPPKLRLVPTREREPGDDDEDL